MTPAQATVEVFWTAYQALPVKERVKFLKKIISSDKVYEDMIDAAAIEDRKREPSISLEEYMRKRAKRKSS
jgi:hypothetical protein